MAKTGTKDPLRCLARIGRYPEIRQFYLAGGTAINIQLHHRRSMDLDFFTADKFDPQRIIHALKSGAGLEILDMDERTLHLRLGGIPVSFFEYPYPLLGSTDYYGVKIASLEDIGLMKIIEIVQRGEKKDFVDLYFILHKGGVTLEALLKLWDKKFEGVAIETGSVLKSLIYFDDAEKSGPLLVPDLQWPAVKRFFEKEAERLVKIP